MFFLKAITYRRVSTQKQQVSGLGLDAQTELLQRYLASVGNPEIIAEFTEVESGKKSDRPKLLEALALCKKHKATLVIAKLDRLARNVHFISGLLETGVDFVAADMPHGTSKVMIQMHAVMSEWERDQISARTKAALAAAKARGTKLGVKGPENLRRNIEERQQQANEFALKLQPLITGFRSQGLTLRACVDQLNSMKIPSATGKSWHVTTLRNVMARFDSEAAAAV